MTAQQEFQSLLACPRCGTPLEHEEGAHRCTSCRVTFPELGGIAFLFAEPNAARAQWRDRYHMLESKLERDVASLAQTLARKDLGAPTRARLESLKSATEAHIGGLKALLAPLATAEVATKFETYLALRTRLPAQQGISSYYANVHRDWSWGAEENAASIAALEQALGAQGAFGRTLVLGAGAGRLAYDIWQHTSSSLTVALDLNPLLVLLAQRVTAGEPVELHEFPIAPKRSEQQAVLRVLRAERPADDTLQFVIADALRAPFAPAAFDTVVTPWFVDIVEEDFDTLARRINGLLKPQGQWLNFGSLSFHHADPALCYGLEECIAAMKAAGLETAYTHEREIPYMCSPASRHGRRETVLTWRAVKTRDAEPAPRPSALPEWLVEGAAPVPLLPAFQAQIMSTRIYAYIMSLIDGRRSLRDIAQVLEKQGLMGHDEAEPAIRSFLIKMYEESTQPQRY